MGVPFEVIDDTCNGRVIIFYRKLNLPQKGPAVVTTERLELTSAEALELAEQLMRIVRKPRTDYQKRS